MRPIISYKIAAALPCNGKRKYVQKQCFEKINFSFSLQLYPLPLQYSTIIQPNIFLNMYLWVFPHVLSDAHLKFILNRNFHLANVHTSFFCCVYKLL